MTSKQDAPERIGVSSDLPRRAGGASWLGSNVSAMGKEHSFCPCELGRSRRAGDRFGPWLGRVGRSAAGRALDSEAIEHAVSAAVRHQDTCYDELLMAGVERGEARAQVRDDVARVLDAWRQ